MLRIGAAVLLALGVGLAIPLATLAAGTVEQTQTTDSYKIVLSIGPVEQMLTPDQATGATEGEVMVEMPGMGMPGMSDMDEGHPVNHHLEAHVYDKMSGAIVDDMAPTITVTPQDGAARTLDAVMGMYGVQEGQSDMHFGQNVYLPDGQYSVAVTVGSETATFSDLMVSAEAAMTPPSGEQPANPAGAAEPAMPMPAQPTPMTPSVPVPSPQTPAVQMP